MYLYNFSSLLYIVGNSLVLYVYFAYSIGAISAMKKIARYLLLLLLLFQPPTTASAADSPTLVTPLNAAAFSTAKPKLTWFKYSDCESKSCYKIEISEKEDFTSLEKSTYTNGVKDVENSQLLSYSPNLSEGTWYWHIKGKNDDESWSNFSETRSFSIGSEFKPQANSIPSQNVLGAATTTSQKNFTITSDQNTLKDLDPLTINITIENIEPNSSQFLKAAFYKEGSSNYFGLTQVNSNWVKNGSSYDSQFPISTDGSGHWQGNLTVRNDPTDTGYPGSGNYQLKIGRYSTDGSGPDWSNSLSVTIEGKKMTTSMTTSMTATTQNATPKPSVSETPTPAFNANADVLGAESLNFSSDGDNSENNYKLPDITENGGTGDGGIPPIDQKVLVAGQKSTNWWFISSGTILFGLGGFYYWRSKRKSSVSI